jgi:Sulfotransferase family
MSLDRHRFFFCHLQKTAGTSLILRVRRNYPSEAIYPNKSDGDIVTSVISVEHLLARWAARGDHVRFVSGHFPLCTTELLGGDFITLTVLREPVGRTLSYLRHYRDMTPADADLTLEEVYDDDFRFHGLIHNHMTKMLSLLPEEMDAGALTRVEFDSERLERAKRRLASVDALGLQEELDAFCDQIADRFEWRLGPSLRANRTRADEVSPELRARILTDNALDLELYDFARDLVARRGTIRE